MPLPRRLLLGATGALPLAARADMTLTDADLLVVAMSDLHSAQERAPAALGALDAVLAANRHTPILIVINGDVFERGNVVALRSAGVADWSFLAALRRRAPVILNIGNHETALLDDLAEVIRRAGALDLIVLTNIRDRRTGQGFAAERVEWPMRGGRKLVVIGIATDDIATYRAVVRPTLDIPEPPAWTRAHLPGLVEGADAVVVLSHAGVAADRAILPLLPPGALMLGGHEHLRFTHAEAATRYVHSGSWNRFLTLAGFSFAPGAPRLTLRELTIEPGHAEDARQAALVREVMAAHLGPEEREVLFRLPAPLPLGAAARRAAAAVAAATGSALGLVGHTTFGTGLPAGEVTRFAFDAFLRFDGTLFRAEADAAALSAIADRANQDGEVPLYRRTGDFVHASAQPTAPAMLATNGWTRMNARRYLGTEALSFAEVPGLMLKPVVAAALRGA